MRSQTAELYQNQGFEDDRSEGMACEGSNDGFLLLLCLLHVYLLSVDKDLSVFRCVGTSLHVTVAVPHRAKHHHGQRLHWLLSLCTGLLRQVKAAEAAEAARRDQACHAFVVSALSAKK